MRIALIIGVITLFVGVRGQRCPSFFNGTNCDVIECVNGGYATAGNVCICPPGYLGIHCEAVKPSLPPRDHYKAGGTSFNILNINLHTQYWGVKTYENIRTAIYNFTSKYTFNSYNYRFSTSTPYLDDYDEPVINIDFSSNTKSTVPVPLANSLDTGLYWCYQVEIYEQLILLIREGSLRNTAVTIITQHPPTLNQLEEAQQTAVAFGVRVNVFWISDQTFNRCKDADVAGLKTFVDLTGGLFVQLQSELNDSPTQSLITQMLLTHYKPQFVSIQSFDSCDDGQTVPVVIDPVVNGPYNFVFLGDNAAPTSTSYRACLLQQPLRSFDKKLTAFSSPDPTCSSVTVKANGSCTMIVFTNGNATFGPVDLAIYTTYVEDSSIDSSRYGIVEGVPFYPAFHVEAPSSSSLVTVNSISASFDSSWNPVLQKRSPAAYEWIPSRNITCDSTKTYSLFLNISVDTSVVQRAVRVACLQAPPAPTEPVTTTAEPTTTEVPTTVETTVVSTVQTTVEPTVDTTSQGDVSSSTAMPEPTCNQPGIPFSFLFSYSTELDAKTYGLVMTTVVQAIKNYPFNGSILTDSYLDSTDSTIQKPKDVQAFSLDLNGRQPTSTNALGETRGSNAVPVIQNFLKNVSDETNPIPLENSVLFLLPSRLPLSTSDDLPSAKYIDFVNQNVKVFSVISLASLIDQGQMIGRTGALFNKLAAVSNGHFIVANETIGRDVNSDYNKIVSQVMQFGYGQDLLFSRNIGSSRLNTNIGTVRIPQSMSGDVTITITVSLSVVDTNAPNPPNRLLLAFRPAKGSSSGATVVNFLTDSTVTRYDASNFYITTITVPAGEDRDLVLQYNRGVDDNDLLLRMWVDRSTYHTAKYVNLDIEDAPPNDKEGAALRIILENDCYKEDADRARILITDCNGDVSTKYDTDQLSGVNLTDTTSPFKYLGFAPFFCDSPPSTSTSCISGTEGKYDVQLTFEDYSVTRSFWCQQSSEAFNEKCKNQDVYGNYQCTGNSPFMRGPTGRVLDCSGHGNLTVDFTNGIGSEVYSCECEDGYNPPNCASASCDSPNLDPLATDNSYHTFTLVLGLDHSVSTFSVLQEDVSQFLTLTEISSIWKYQLLTYCPDGSVTNLYSGGDLTQFNAIFNSLTTNVVCNSPPTNGSVDLTTIYTTAVKGLGRNVRGMVAFYTESQDMLTVSLEEFIVASRAYRQELYVLTAPYVDDETKLLEKLNSTISQAALSTGGFLVQSLVDSIYKVHVDKNFIPTILSGKTSLAYLSTQQTAAFNVVVNSKETVAWVVTWGTGDKFKTGNAAAEWSSGCTFAGDTMAMCKLTGANSYSFVAIPDAYTVAVFITNEDSLSPSFQIVSDLSQDAANAVSTTSSDTRTIISMYVPNDYKIVDNDGDGGLTRTIQRQSCTFGYTAYSVFADSKYTAGANTAMITLQSDESSPKYTRYFVFGTTGSPTCRNGGVALTSTGSCACPTGFQGPDCSLVDCATASIANAWSDVCVCNSLEDVTCANRYTSVF